MTTKKNAHVLLFVMLLWMLFPLSTVRADTPTPEATETIQPTITPFVPNVDPCGNATSIIPTSDISDPDPFYTPTPCPPGGPCAGGGEGEGGAGSADATATANAAAHSTLVANATGTAFSLTATANPGSGCYSGFTLGQFTYSEFSTTEPSLQVSLSCSSNGYALTCNGSMSSSDNTFGDEGVYVKLPIYGLTPGTSVFMTYHDTYVVTGGSSYTNTMRPGLLNIGTGGCSRLNNTVPALPGTHTCTVGTVTASGGHEVEWFSWLGGGGGKTTTITFSVVFSFAGNCTTLTPMPSPTVTVTPDCGGASGDLNEVLPSSELVAYFNPPTITSGGCYDILNPVTVDLPDLSWSPLDMPASVSFAGWRVCINLLTMSAVFASVDWIVVLAGIVTSMCGMFIYRMFQDMK